MRRLLAEAEHANRALAAQARHLVELLSAARKELRATWSQDDRDRAEGRL